MRGAALARKAKKPTVTLPYWALEPTIDPKLIDERGITPERERHAAGASEWGRDERDRKTVRTMRDSPLERMLMRGVITPQQYRAGEKYRLHWYRAGLSSPLQTIDLNRIFSNDDAGFSGMAKTEAQAFHRQQFRIAVGVVGAISAALLDAVICAEKNLDEAGTKLGWNAKPQAIAAATERTKYALDQLCSHWGIG